MKLREVNVNETERGECDSLFQGEYFLEQLVLLFL